MADPSPRATRGDQRAARGSSRPAAIILGEKIDNGPEGSQAVKCKLCLSIEAELSHVLERSNNGVEQINREKHLQSGAPRCTMPLIKRRELIISPRGLRQRGADAVEYGTPAKTGTRDEERNDVGLLRDRGVRDCARFHEDVAARARMADEVDVHRVRSPNAPAERKVRAF